MNVGHSAAGGDASLEFGRRFAASPRSRPLCALLEYWQARKGDRALPGRPDLDPVDIGPLLPHIILIDVERAPERFRVRLVGTHVVDTLGRDNTGRYYDEVYRPEAYATFVEGIRRVIAGRAPLSGYGQVYFAAGREYLTYESLTLPLAADGRTVDMLLVGLHVGVPPFEGA